MQNNSDTFNLANTILVRIHSRSIYNHLLLSANNLRLELICAFPRIFNFFADARVKHINKNSCILGIK